MSDEYFGVKVTEDYRWLENWDDPAVKRWSAAQNTRTRDYLEHLPSYSAIHARLVQPCFGNVEIPVWAALMPREDSSPEA